MKKVVVTGGSGFIGSSLAQKLVQLGHTVTIFDNNSRGSLSKIEK